MSMIIKSNWEKYLPLVEFAYNNTVHTRQARHLLRLWRQGRRFHPFFLRRTNIFEADRFVEDMKTAYDKVKYALQRTQAKQKKSADKHRRELSFNIGAWVLLRFEKARLRKMKGKERLYPKIEYAVLWAFPGDGKD